MLPLLLLLLAPEGEILEARLEAKVDGSRDVAVRLAYRIERSGADPVRFSALQIDGVALEGISASAAENALLVSLDPGSGPKLEGLISLPEGATGFELRYLVRGGALPTEDGIRVRLPCAILDLKTAETRTGLFASEVGVPPGLTVVDGFPSDTVATADGVVRSEMPLVPAFVSFRASSGAALLTPSRLATAAVVALLLAVGFFGIRRARGVKA